MTSTAERAMQAGLLAVARPLLIMHIPKTAGTSLRSIAEQQYRSAEFATLYPGSDSQIEDFLACSGSPAAVIGHFRFGLHERLTGRCRYVTFLRDPVDQVVSHFNFLAASTASHHREQLRPEDHLEDFVAHPWAQNLQTQFVCGWLPDAIAADPDAAFERTLAVLAGHFIGVGLVERFEASIHALAPALGWQIKRIPHLNPSPPGPRAVLRRDLDPSLARRIEDANACDRRLYEHVRERVALLPEAPRVTLRGRAFAVAERILARFGGAR